MTYGAILVVVDGTEDSAGRLDAAIALAEKFDASLDVVSFGLILPPMVMSGGYSVEILQSEADTAAAEARKALEAIEPRLARTSVRWRKDAVSCFTTAVGQALAARALFADLVVLGAPRDDAPESTRMIEGALFDGPTSVLVLPGGWRGDAVIGTEVTLAWDGRKEASRAAREAMPFLKRADNVDIVTVKHLLGDEPFEKDPGLGVATWLTRRGVSAEVRQLEGGPVADKLMADARGRGSNLVVMGGYGHSRLLEAVFGGVTRNLLAHSSIPLLLAH